ncbi:MAG: methyltransferase [Candidatus Hodarchaeota archaeon]
MDTFHIAGLSIKVPPQVYPPSEDTFLLMKLLDSHFQKKTLKRRNWRLLEVGCGSGLITIHTRRLFSSATIFATDISIDAIKTTITNILRNHENPSDYILVNADLCRCFSSSVQFDYALINPPYLPYGPASPWNCSDLMKAAIDGGRTGAEIINSFLTEVVDRLLVNRIAYVYSTYSEEFINTNCLLQRGYEVQNHVNQVFMDETLNAVMWVKDL